MTDPKLDPSVLSDHVKKMQERAQVCRALMAGTLEMRKARQRYLPMEPAESPDAYESRLNKTVLFPAFKKTVETMVGKPFGQEMTIGDDVPVRIQECLENVDLAGRDFDCFARDTFQESLADGIGWILVDFPRVPENATLADERALGVRPYLVHIPLSNALGWRTSIINGAHRIDQFRYMECVEVPDGMFGTKEIKRVRVLEPGMVTVWVQDEKQEWVVDEEASGYFLGPNKQPLAEIPLVTVYTGRKSFLCAEPPLEGMAWLNVEHWQSRSDQRHILHRARVPILFGKDLNLNSDGKVVLGTSLMITGSGPDADLKWVEIIGNAIAAGRQDLVDIESAMQRGAGEIIARVSGQKTATETDQESTEGESQLRKWLMTYEDALEEVLRFMALWLGEKQGGSVDIAMDWDDDELASDMIVALNGLQQAGNLSRNSLIWNLQQRNMLPPGRDVDTELALIDGEGPSGLSAVPMPLKTAPKMPPAAGE